MRISKVTNYAALSGGEHKFSEFACSFSLYLPLNWFWIFNTTFLWTILSPADRSKHVCTQLKPEQIV